MRTLLAILALTLSAPALDIVLSWDASPPADEVYLYRIYEDQNANWVKIGETQFLMLTLLNIPAGPHTYSVAAVNVRGEGMKSDPASVPAGVPVMVRGLRVLSIENPPPLAPPLILAPKK